ncbi:lasso peptide biosynthesis B2 protein [Thermosporothrix hazakensis]|uniref:lasso peptide biosynthesis B2 protein n=1 Tax=Thermosporothrix hazakensis TaxID=644383 RepID=UPI002482E8E4|nr:lasso peptide biosynthesis B2 protein [Thermosporothrix hazakensis]
MAPQALCVTRSVAFCASVCRAGIPAHVTIGRDRFEFHAWVEVDGVVVNALPEVATGSSPLVRIPIVHPLSHAASRPLQAGKHTA